MRVVFKIPMPVLLALGSVAGCGNCFLGAGGGGEERGGGGVCE